MNKGEPNSLVGIGIRTTITHQPSGRGVVPLGGDPVQGVDPALVGVDVEGIPEAAHGGACLSTDTHHITMGHYYLDYYN